MEITHELLLKIGFTEVPNRTTRYSYKGFVGRLEPACFCFSGFSLPITKLTDLKYMMMMVDYNVESTFRAYPSNMN